MKKLRNMSMLSPLFSFPVSDCEKRVPPFHGKKGGGREGEEHGAVPVAPRRLSVSSSRVQRRTVVENGGGTRAENGRSGWAIGEGEKCE